MQAYFQSLVQCYFSESFDAIHINYSSDTYIS